MDTPANRMMLLGVNDLEKNIGRSFKLGTKGFFSSCLGRLAYEKIGNMF
jgi:hypothetical protein